MKEYYVPKQPGQTKKSIVEKMAEVESFLTGYGVKGENTLADPEYGHISFYSNQVKLIDLVFSLERMLVEGELAIRRKTSSNIEKFRAFIKEYESDSKDLLDKHKVIEEYNNNERLELDGRSKRLEEITEGCNLAKILGAIDQEIQARNLSPIRWDKVEFRCRKKNTV